jgi:hypothetical protein
LTTLNISNLQAVISIFFRPTVRVNGDAGSEISKEHILKSQKLNQGKMLISSDTGDKDRAGFRLLVPGHWLLVSRYWMLVAGFLNLLQKDKKSWSF